MPVIAFDFDADLKSIQKNLQKFLNYTGEIFSSPKALAKQMARLTKAIRLATLNW